jgi:hypothetical protein
MANLVWEHVLGGEPGAPEDCECCHEEDQRRVDLGIPSIFG